MDVLAKRFAKYGLTLHPDKTRLVAFRRPDKAPPDEPPSTSDLLGFTLHWARSRAGKWTVKSRTAKDRFARALKRVAIWCREHRHSPLVSQWKALSKKLHGHFGYYGSTNMQSLKRFRWRVIRLWKKWLARRSNAGLTWDAMLRIQQRYPLPEARIVHQYGT